METSTPSSDPAAGSRSFAPDDKTLIICDGVLLHVFIQRQAASVLPVAGMTGIQRLGKSMVLANRFGTDIHLRVDKDRKDESLAFEEWLMARAAALA
jgi:hypothetical protein